MGDVLRHFAFTSICILMSCASVGAHADDTRPTPFDDGAPVKTDQEPSTDALPPDSNEDVVESAPPADPLDVAGPSEPAPVDDGARPVVPVPETGPFVPSDRYLACRRLLVEERAFSSAEHCFARLADAGGREAALAKDMAALAHDLGEPARAAQDVTVDNSTRLAERLVLSGAAEGLIGGALSGGIYGFLATATVQSFLRTDNVRAAPWLLGVPAATLLAGGGLGLVLGFVSEPGDAALVSSSSLIGITAGTVLQAMFFWRNDDVREIPLRFLAPLATGLAFTALSATAAPFIDVTPGDAALATSAALWAPFFATMLALTGSAMMSDLRISFPTTTPLDAAVPLGALLATSLAAWLATLAVHRFVDIPRPATWLIELGALAGAVVVTATLPFVFLAPQGGIPLPFATVPLGYTLGMAAGAGTGLALGFLSGALVPQLKGVGEFLERSPIALTPVIAPDPVTPSRTNVSLALTGALPW